MKRRLRETAVPAAKSNEQDCCLEAFVVVRLLAVVVLPQLLLCPLFQDELASLQLLHAKACPRQTFPTFWYQCRRSRARLRQLSSESLFRFLPPLRGLRRLPPSLETLHRHWWSRAEIKVADLHGPSQYPGQGE